MAQTLAQFIAAYTGRCVTHPSYTVPNQCVDLIAYWLDNIGLPGALHGSAYQYPSEHPAGLTWIKNAQSNVPSPGDIMVYGVPPALASDGHTDIFVSGNLHTFTTFDQNWCGGSGPSCCCKLVSHASYAGVIGWQHPIAPLPGGAPPPPGPAPPAATPVPPIVAEAFPLALVVAAIGTGVYLVRRSHTDVGRLKQRAALWTRSTGGADFG